MGTMREAIVAPSLDEAATAPNSFHPRGLKSVRPNAYAIIFSISGGLSLATASECHSITHLPSLLYGMTLWGWWGLLASVLWMVGRKLPALKVFSPKNAIVHLCLAPLLAWLHLLLLWSISFTVP